ncbi:peptidase M48-like protein [Kushneria sinocarnis]|uniref:Peptidase M48-like protein n=1 Tax=Kushneria sinocarnis TaxID=595502 RepID=A0A420X0D8_9GAMM|nr:M48 family metallopeptidase [Kushneria sinocarnis]RKR06915.1 peptidase M48-like protein [Kushneria sinocarnis]
MCRRLTILLVMLLPLGLGACATSPLGRSQLALFDDSQLQQQGAEAYQQYAGSHERATGATADYASCVANAIIRELPQGDGPEQWQVGVFKDDSPNAFALPGGYVVINSGMLKVAENQDQLATVVGHEMAHVLADHANERTSTQTLTQSGLGVIQAVAGSGGEQLATLLGAGAQYGILLPYSRKQESEADVLGLRLMARAGFNPEASLQLWQNMSQASGSNEPPAWASTHPSNGQRINALESHMSEAQQTAARAREASLRPDCQRP